MIKLDIKEVAKSIIVTGAKSVAVTAGFTVLARLIVGGIAGVKDLTITDLLDK